MTVEHLRILVSAAQAMLQGNFHERSKPTPAIVSFTNAKPYFEGSIFRGLIVPGKFVIDQLSRFGNIRRLFCDVFAFGTTLFLPGDSSYCPSSLSSPTLQYGNQLSVCCV